MLTDSPFAIRVMAFANIGAIDMVRMLEEAVTDSVTQIVSVITSEDKSDALIRSTALLDKTVQRHR